MHTNANIYIPHPVALLFANFLLNVATTTSETISNTMRVTTTTEATIAPSEELPGVGERAELDLNLYVGLITAHILNLSRHKL